MPNYITLQKLQEMGFTEGEIDLLTRTNLLEKIDSKNYSCNRLKDLMNYSRQLKYQFELQFSIRCLALCYYLNPNSYNINFELFYRSIRALDFYGSIPYLEYLIAHAAPGAKENYNVYLYLLSMIIDLPERLKIIALSVGKSDLTLTNIDDDENIGIENEIRTLIFAQKFKSARIEMKKNPNITGKNILDSHIEYTLVGYANNRQIENRYRLENLIKSGNYEESIIFLESLSQKHQLSLIEKYTYRVLKDLLRLRYTHMYPVEKPHIKTEDKNIYDAIDYGDYFLAMDLANNYSRMNGNILYQALSGMIKELSHQEDPIKKCRKDLPFTFSFDAFISLVQKDMNISTINYILDVYEEDSGYVILIAIKRLYETKNILLADQLFEKISRTIDITPDIQDLYNDILTLKNVTHKRFSLK